MTAFTNSRPHNSIISFLSEHSQSRLTPLLEPVLLSANDRLAERGVPLQYAYFLNTGIASSGLAGDGYEHPAAALVGWEGVVCAPALFSAAASAFDVRMEVAGGGFRIQAALLRSIAGEDATVFSLIARFSDVLTAQIASTAVSAATQSVNARVARLLLMLQDRFDEDEVLMTHERLGSMLGTRRASITEAVHILEGRRFIRASRGRIAIRDRSSLMRLAGKMYGAAEEHYSVSLGLDPTRLGSETNARA